MLENEEGTYWDKLEMTKMRPWILTESSLPLLLLSIDFKKGMYSWSSLSFLAFHSGDVENIVGQSFLRK